MPQHHPREARAKIMKALWQSRIKTSGDQSQWKKRLGREIRLDEPKPLNKSQIESSAGMRARQTIVNNIRLLKAKGIQWIRVAHAEKWRTGDPTEFYELTDLGCYWTAVLNPELEPEIRKKLGARFDQYGETREQGRRENLKHWCEIAEQVVTSGTAPPNWHLQIEVSANRDGHVTWNVHHGNRPREEADKL